MEVFFLGECSNELRLVTGGVIEDYERLFHWERQCGDEMLKELLRADCVILWPGQMNELEFIVHFSNVRFLGS